MARARKASQPKASKTPRGRNTSAATSVPRSSPAAEPLVCVEAEIVKSRTAKAGKRSKSKKLTPKFPAPSGVPVAESMTVGKSEPSSDLFANPPVLGQMSQATSAPARLPVAETTVLVHEDHFDFWNETVELYAISQFGASFNVSRACGVGRLIELTIFATAEFHAFDSTEYPTPIVCLVQQCNEYEREGRPAYHVGVVFVGRSLPDSFNNNPKQCYRVAGTHKNGLFRILETVAPHKTRRHPRFKIKFEVKLLLINKAERSIVPASGVTNDVGAMGISVKTTLMANIGDKIKVACREIDFFGVAVVRNRRSLFGFEYLLQMEFLESKFPIGRLLSVPEGVLEGFTE